MTTSSFPTNTFSLYAGRRDTKALERIAARRRRVQRWSRPMAAGIVGAAFAFTAFAGLRDGGVELQASWRNVTRPPVTVRTRDNGESEAASARVWNASPAAGRNNEQRALTASLTAPVPRLVGSSAQAEADTAQAAAPVAEAPGVQAPRAQAPVARRAETLKPIKVARQQVGPQLGALDKLGSDIAAQLK
jgi:hypothetical protein